MNPIARLEEIGGQHTSAVKRIRHQFEQADQRARETSRKLAAQERQRLQANRDKQRAPRKPASGALTPSELLSHPELLVWALRK